VLCVLVAHVIYIVVKRFRATPTNAPRGFDVIPLEDQTKNPS